MSRLRINYALNLLIILAVLLLLHTGAAGAAEYGKATPEFAVTEDGLKLAIYHYPPRGTTRSAIPVIVCPGVAADHYFLDPKIAQGLAPYLQEAGFDVWSLELRHYGNSQKPAKGFWDFGKWKGNVDTYIRYDVPAAINYVRRKTGAKQVFWVGHSRGSAIAYGHMIKNDQNDFAGCVMLSGFVGFNNDVDNYTHTLLRMGGAVRNIFLNNDLIPFRQVFATISYMPGEQILGKTFIYKIILNHRNMTPEMLHYLNHEILQSMPVNEFKQLLFAAHTGDFRGFESDYSYLSQFDKINRPILAITGSLDQLVPPLAVSAALAKVSSPDKKHIVLSTANGYSADYGHADILLGPKVVQEVFPLISDWLAAHAAQLEKSEEPIKSTTPEQPEQLEKPEEPTPPSLPEPTKPAAPEGRSITDKTP